MREVAKMAGDARDPGRDGEMQRGALARGAQRQRLGYVPADKAFSSQQQHFNGRARFPLFLS